MVGPVLTEILQGARTETEFSFVAERLGSLSFIEADQETWVRAGELNFQLQSQERILAFADLIISALALQHHIPLYTVDDDFQRVPGLELYEP